MLRVPFAMAVYHVVNVETSVGEQVQAVCDSQHWGNRLDDLITSCLLIQ
jgi:hypothetical protein